MCPNLTYQRRNTLSHLCTESEQPHTARNVNLERSVKLNLDFEITDSARWKMFSPEFKCKSLKKLILETTVLTSLYHVAEMSAKLAR